jgi:hypothetical protein
MKLSIEWPGEKDPVVIDVGAREVICKEVYVGIGIETDSGLFGIAQRDGVIEIMHNGKLLIDADLMKDCIETNSR